MAHEPTADEQAISWNVLRRRLYFENVIDTMDAPVWRMQVALQIRGIHRDDIEAIWHLVGNDGIWAARKLLETTP